MGRRSRGRRVLLVASEALAIGIGVFLSLWADQWREDRGRNAESLESLARLSANLESDSADMAGLSYGATIAVEAIRTVLQEDPTDPEAPVRIAGLTPNVIGGWILDPSGQEYEALQGSGRLGLIKDSELLAALADYYSGRRYLAELMRLDVDQAHAVAELMYPHVEFPRDVFRGQAGSVYPVPTAAPSLATLLSDRVYVNEMTYLGFLKELIAGAAQDQLDGARALVDVISMQLAG